MCLKFISSVGDLSRHCHHSHDKMDPSIYFVIMNWTENMKQPFHPHLLGLNGTYYNTYSQLDAFLS